MRRRDINYLVDDRTFNRAAMITIVTQTFVWLAILIGITFVIAEISPNFVVGLILASIVLVGLHIALPITLDWQLERMLRNEPVEKEFEDS